MAREPSQKGTSVLPVVAALKAHPNGKSLVPPTHDTGTMRIVGWRPMTERVVMQLTGFQIPLEGFVRLQGYYLEELGRVVGVAVESTVTRSTARGHRYCEWELELAPTPASAAYIGSLSIVP